MSDYMRILNSPYMTPDQKDVALEAPRVPTNSEEIAENLEVIELLTVILESTSDPEGRSILSQRISYLELRNRQRSR